MITVDQVKKLREKTGISVMQCKRALEGADGDIDKAINILKAEGAKVSQKKQGRVLGAGTIGSYVHGTGDIGSMVELLCETDFVSKNKAFNKIAKDLAMHLAAMPSETKEEFLNQEFIKDSSQKISDIISSAVQKFGENIDIGNFIRFSILGR